MSSMNCHKGKYSCNAFDDIFSALESERDGLKLAVNTQTDLYRTSLVEIERLKAELEEQKAKDLLTFGESITKDGKRVHPTDFYKSEPELERDALKAQLDSSITLRKEAEQRQYAAESERDKLKAELEAYKGYETWDHDGMQDQLEDYKADRDHWKALAGKMAEALIKKIELHDSVKPKKLDEALAWRSNDELSDRLCNEVLSAYQAALEGKS